MKSKNAIVEKSADNSVVEKPVMKNKELIIRFILFTIFALVLPIAFIVNRYGLFKDTNTALSGMGFLGIIICTVFIIYVVNMIKKANPNTMTAQCIGGYTKVVLPLVILLLCVEVLGNNIAYFKQALQCIIICESFAIPVNPLPRWAYEKNIELVGLSLKSFWKSAKKIIK